MFERFSQVAHDAVNYALEEARVAGALLAATEHLLVGLLRDESVALEALTLAGISLEGARSCLPDDPLKWATGTPAYSPALRDALNWSMREALDMESIYIGPEHLLLGLLDADDGGAIPILRDANTDPRSIREHVMSLLIRRGAGGRAAERYGIEILRRAFKQASGAESDP